MTKPVWSHVLASSALPINTELYKIIYWCLLIELSITDEHSCFILTL